MTDQRLAPTVSRRSETTVRLEDIAAQLSQLARREQESASYLAPEPPARDHDTLNRILGRIDSNERQTVEAFSAVNERLSVLGRQIAMSNRQKTFEKPEDVPGFASLEQAIRNVVDHIELSENRTRETFKSMQDRLAEMANRAAAAPSDDLLRTAPSFAAIEGRLNEINQRLQTQEQQAHAGVPKAVKDELSKLAERIDEVRVQPNYAMLEHQLSDLGQRVQQQEAHTRSGLPKAVRDELAKLAGRIDEVRTTAHSLAHEAQTQAVAAAQTELHDIEQRIHGLLRDAQSAISNQSAGATELNRVRGEIASLNRRIDEQVQATASDRDLQALQVALEQLSARVAQGPDMRPLADLDRRLNDIASRVEQAQIASKNPPQLADLNNRIGALDRQLQQVMTGPRDTESLAALETQLSTFNERLSRTEEQLSHFATIERAITQLYDGLEQSKDVARQVAAEAADRAADRAVQQHTQALAAQGPSAELSALQEGLKAVRHSAELSDQRSQETLAAVHETLEQIVGKLGELETSAAGHQLAMSMAQQATAAAQAAPPPAAETAVPPEPAQWSAPAESSPFDPLESFAAPEPAHATEPPPAASPAAPAFADQDAAPPADDYIAAARRLAQAATGSSPPPLAAGPRPEAGAPPSARRLKLPFDLPKFTRRSKPMVFTGGKLVAEEKPKSKPMNRRTLVLAGIVLLLAAGVFGMRMVKRTQTPVKQTSSIEQTIGAQPQTVASATATPPADAAAAVISDNDNLVTGSLPAKKTDTTLSSIIAEPGSAAVTPETPPPAVGSDSLRTAAAHGDAKAQFVVASRYLDGQQVPQDFTKAAYWYQQAATRGLAPAEYRIATLFERGRGVPLDTATALVWYERAASAGNVKAMHNAAVIAAGNQSGTPNYDKAFRWFKEAAQHGLKDSQYNLAVLYERGLGTRPDAGEAYVWYRLAAAQGDADARTRADLLQKTLTPTTVAAADARVSSWQSLPSLDEANAVAVSQPDWNTPADAMVSPDQSQPAAAAPAASAPADQGGNPVKTIQQLLQKLGYNIGAPDGRMGTRTTSAIRLFQLQAGMKVTGEVTPELISEAQAKAG